MGKTFSVNPERFDPYRNYRFLVYFGEASTPVAGFSRLTGFRRSTDPIDYREGGNAIPRAGRGRIHYEPVTLERGITTTATSWSGPTARRSWMRAGLPRRLPICEWRFASNSSTRPDSPCTAT